MQIPLETVISGLSEMARQGRISRDDSRAVVGELISSVYNDRIDKTIQRMREKKREAISQAEYLM